MDCYRRLGSIMPNIAAILKPVPFGAAPATPTASYTAQNQFTITNYDPTLTYTVTGGSRSGNIVTISSVGTTATVKSSYPRGLATSAARSLLTAVYTRVLTSVAANPGSAGCGPRGTICCPGGSIVNTNGATCVPGPGTQGAFAECSGICSPSECFGLFITCWNWRWNNYSTGPEGTGYTLIGSTWGKVV